MSGPAPDFYVAGGTLRQDAPSYVERQADDELYGELLAGQFCHVLTSRQMGKSSLMIRTAARLRANGVSTAVLDLTAVGQNLTPEQWYGGLLLQLGQRVDLEDCLLDFWYRQERLGLLQRWIAALREVVLPRSPNGITIFVDEIDVVRSLPFSVDEFFSGIRECYNLRSQIAMMDQLRFCLLGVVAPTELIRDPRTTPFNIGRRIELPDFTEREAAPLARGLTHSKSHGTAILERILYWTGGHPYLTLRLCLAVVSNRNRQPYRQVDDLCTELFLSPRVQERDDNLLFVRERMLRSGVDLASLLDLYQKVRNNRSVPDEDNPLSTTLRLSGIVRTQNGRLEVRNRIYARVFGKGWIEASMPEAELRRQRKAYRRGLWRAALIATVIIAIVSLLAAVAFKERRHAEDEAETSRRLLYDTRMRLAQGEWANGNVDRVRELLAETYPKPGEEDLRGFEWYMFSRFTRLAHLRLQLSNPVLGVTLSKDGKLMIVSKPMPSRNVVQVKTCSLQPKCDLRVSFSIPSEEGFDLLDFSPDRHSLIVADPAGKNGVPGATASSWDLNSGTQTTVFRGHRHRLTWLSLSPDGRQLATADSQGTLMLWDAKTASARFAFKTSQSLRIWGAFSPDGKKLAMANESPQVTLWDTVTGKRMLPIFSQGVLTKVAFFPDGRRLLAHGKDGALQVWDIVTRQRLTTLKGHSGSVEAVAFSPDGMILATGGYDRTIRLWSTTTLRPMGVIKGHGSVVRALTFSPDGKYLISGAGDATVEIWEANQEPELKLPHERKAFLAAAFTPSNELLAVGRTLDKTIKIWNLSSGREAARLNDSEGNVISAEFSPQADLLATGGTDKLVKIWNATTGQLMRAMPAHSDGVYAFGFSPDGRLLVSGGRDRSLRLWNLLSGEATGELKGELENAWRAIFSPDGKYIASATEDGPVQLWEVATRRVIRTFQGHSERVKAIAFSRDSRLLATGGEDRTLRLWDLNTAKQLSEFGFADDLQRASFSPDGKRLVTGGVDGTIKVWDVLAAEQLMSLPGHTDEVESVIFSSDGTKLATSSTDGRVRLWQTATNQ